MYEGILNVQVSSTDRMQGWMGSCCWPVYSACSMSEFTGKKSQKAKCKTSGIVSTVWSCNSQGMHHGVFFCLADPKWIIADPKPAAV